MTDNTGRLSTFQIVVGIATIVACIAAILVVPEVRQRIGLDPRPTDTSATEDPSSTYQIKVSANKLWQDTNISISRGDHVTIKYISGTWSREHQDANGAPSGYICSLSGPGCNELVPDAVQGSLVGKIGEQILKIGNYIDFVAEQSGSLFLSRNNEVVYLQENGEVGEIIVQVTVTKGR